MSRFIHDSPLEAAGTSPLFPSPFFFHSFIHSFFLLGMMIRSFFPFSSNTCDRQGQIPPKQIKITHRDLRRRFLFQQASKRQEREIILVTWRRFPSFLWCRFFRDFPFVFFIQNGSRTVATVFRSVQSPLCKSLEVPLSVRLSFSLFPRSLARPSLSLCSCFLARPASRVISSSSSKQSTTKLC